MSTNSMKKERRPSARIRVSSAVLAMLALAAPAARAQADEPNPYYIGASQAFTHDTNVLRAAHGTSDTISATSLLAGLDQPLGRGRLAADLTYILNRFQDQGQLDNNEYNARARLDWATVERVSGDIRAYDRESLNRYDLSAPEGISFKDLVRTSGLAATARVGVVTRWTFDGGAAFDTTKHSADQEENRNLRQGSVNAGMRYRPNDLFNARMGLRYSEGRYYDYGFNPDGSSLEDHFNRNDLDFSVFWAPTGNSSLDARLSATDENHSVQSARDARTWTGALGYNWRASGKTAFRLELVRDTNAGSSNVDFGLVSDESTDTQIRNAINAQVTWDATAKIRVLGTAGYSRRKLDNAFTVSGAGVPASSVQTAHDNTTRGGVRVNYQYSRAVAFACSLNREVRSASGDIATLTYAYNATIGTCSGEFVLR